MSPQPQGFEQWLTMPFTVIMEAWMSSKKYSAYFLL